MFLLNKLCSVPNLMFFRDTLKNNKPGLSCANLRLKLGYIPHSWIIFRLQTLIVNRSLIRFEAINRLSIGIIFRILINDQLKITPFERNLFVNDGKIDYKNSYYFDKYIFFIFFFFHFQEVT